MPVNSLEIEPGRTSVASAVKGLPGLYVSEPVALREHGSTSRGDGDNRASAFVLFYPLRHKRIDGIRKFFASQGQRLRGCLGSLGLTSHNGEKQQGSGSPWQAGRDSAKSQSNHSRIHTREN